MLDAERVSVAGLFAPTSLRVDGGELAMVHGDPGPGLTAFGLVLAGRMRPTAGTVAAGADLAVVDAPRVSEPDGAMPLKVVIGEELAYAGKPSSGDDAARWLAEHDCDDLGATRFEDIEGALRTRLLTELAWARHGVHGLVLDTPDRHTSDHESWIALARAHARMGSAVIVLIATTPPSVLATPPARIGQQDQPEPEQCV